MNKRQISIGSLGGSLLFLGALLGYVVKARADGIPSPTPLYYAGTLTENGQLVTGTRPLTVNVWADGTTQGTPLCSTVVSSPPANVVNGRFRIALASACKTAINQNNNAYVEVIDGSTSLGRSPIGAVPYAVESDHAVSADNGAPSGAVIFFNLAACPAGWTAYAAAQGRGVVGVVDGGTLGAAVGTALGDQENRPTGQHTHTVTDPGHKHPPPNAASGAYIVEGSGGTLQVANANYYDLGADPSGTGSATTGISVNPSGTVAGTNAPYVQLLACQKN
jgi:hypothetical protein